MDQQAKALKHAGYILMAHALGVDEIRAVPRRLTLGTGTSVADHFAVGFWELAGPLAAAAYDPGKMDLTSHDFDGARMVIGDGATEPATDEKLAPFVGTVCGFLGAYRYVLETIAACLMEGDTDELAERVERLAPNLRGCIEHPRAIVPPTTPGSKAAMPDHDRIQRRGVKLESMLRVVVGPELN